MQSCKQWLRGGGTRNLVSGKGLLLRGVHFRVFRADDRSCIPRLSFDFFICFTRLGSSVVQQMPVHTPLE